MEYLYFVSNISLKKESESFLSSFSIKFNYLKTLNMKVAEENEYLEYSEDINTINRGFSEYAVLFIKINM